MSALGHYLEQEGIPTVSISLIREHTEALDPPRALWVPFMLGRPFGVPNGPAFQRRVALTALRLLELNIGPILQDFPEDAPYDDTGEVTGSESCPVSFPRLRSDGSLAERLGDEIAQLGAWHEVAQKRNGRTTLGTTGLSPRELAEYLVAWVDDVPKASFDETLTIAGTLKLAADELKAYYYEARGAQPGRHSPADVLRWFWVETSAGELLAALRDHAAQSDDPAMKGLATLSLVPRAAQPLLEERGAV